jgi:hypothetical protein
MQLGFSREYYTNQGYTTADAAAMVAADQAALAANLPPPVHMNAPTEGDLSAPALTGVTMQATIDPNTGEFGAPVPVEYWNGNLWVYSNGQTVIPQPARPRAVDNTTAANIGMAALTFGAGTVFEAGVGVADAAAASPDLVSAADLSASTADASPLTAPGVSQPEYLNAPAVTEATPSALPEQLSGPGVETGAVPQTAELPQSITPAARQSLIEQIAAKTGSMSGALATVNRLYTAVRGGKPASSGNPQAVVYQRTSAPVPADTGGLGTNVTPMLKQFAVPGIALVAALLSR